MADESAPHIPPWKDTRVWLAAIGFLTVFSGQIVNAYMTYRTGEKAESADVKAGEAVDRADKNRAELGKKIEDVHTDVDSARWEIGDARAEVEVVGKEVKAIPKGKTK